MPKKVRWLYYLSVVLGFLKSLCCLPHAGYGGGKTIRWMEVTTIKGTTGQHEVDGGDDDQREERTTSPKNVCWLYYLSVVLGFLNLFVVSHMAEGQR